MQIGSHSLYLKCRRPQSQQYSSNYARPWSFSSLEKNKKKRFDLFITWAVAANGGLREEVGAVWSGGSDTGVSFITVGHSLGALMEIIMHVHNCPKAKGPGPVCMPSSMQFCGVTALRCEVCWIWQPLYQYRDIYFTQPVCQGPNFDFLA